LFETEALRWLAENAEGPNDDTRAELLQLVEKRDDDAFWDLLAESRDDLAPTASMPTSCNSNQICFYV
jgi:hypothetical protein